MSRFLQIHTLTAWPAALLNRDDAGFAKRIPFGDAIRIRVSSQCLKRHWRMSDGPHALDKLQGSVPTERSRYAFDFYVKKPLIEGGVEAPLAEAIAGKLQELFIGVGAEKAKKAAKEEATEATGTNAVTTPQVVILGKPELDYALQLGREAASWGISAKTIAKEMDSRFNKGDMRNNLKALRLAAQLPAGLNAALFGRMVTGDVLSAMDAAIHVAHAFTVHGETAEPDYFSAVDDLIASKKMGDHFDAGSGHINTTELTTGLFYGYVVVDVPLLITNLGYNRDLAAEVVEQLVHLIATESPGAKKGSTAPYSRSHLVLTEAGDAQPRTLANAFFNPIPTKGDMVEQAYQRLATHIGELDEMYGDAAARLHAAIGPRSVLGTVAGPRGNLSELAASLGEAVRATPIPKRPETPA